MLLIEDFNDEAKNSFLQAQTLFIIVETLEDEHIDKKYGQFYKLISDSMDESKVVFIDTKDVSEVLERFKIASLTPYVHIKKIEFRNISERNPLLEKIKLENDIMNLRK